MKKSVMLLTASVMLVGLLSGCGNKADNEAEYLKDIKADKFVTLGEYKGIEVALEDVEVTEENIEESIASILQNYPMPAEVEGAAEEGFEVTFDFVGKKDGVEFEGGSGENQTLVIGSNTFISDLEQGMIGMTAGEVKDIPVTFPENYKSADLAGQDAVFTVTMHSVKNYPEQELTDEYVDWLTMGENTNVADFRKYLQETMLESANENYDLAKSSMVAEAVVANCKFEKLPEGLVARIKTALTNNITSYASMYGMDMATYLINAQMMSADENAEEVIANEAQKSAQRYLAFQAIANAENLNVTDAEISEDITAKAEEAGKTVEEYEANLDKEGYREYMMTEKVSKFLAENAVVVSAQ